LPMELTYRQRLAPRDIAGDITESNIVEGRHTRKATTKAQGEAYLAHLQHLDDLPGYYAAFSTAIGYGKQQLHRDQLLPLLRSWKELQTHTHRDEFLMAARKEYSDLDKRQTFRPIRKTPNIKTIPLKW